MASYSKACRLKRRGFAGVITIEDPHARAARQLRFHSDPRPAHLVLRFEDLDAQHDGIRTPLISDVEQALAFAQAVGGPLLIHCYAGVSRSTAIALSIIASRHPAGAERRALDALLAIAAQAVPNLLVVRHADHLLRRNGALFETVRAWDESLPSNKIRRQLNERAVLEEYQSLPLT
ncbi:MAG: hypothetical protein AB7K04_01920 [Pseudorhodoplanes sp.]